MKKYFLPRDKYGRYLVIKSFSEKLPTYATKYGITKAQMDDMKDSYLYIKYLMDGEVSADQLSQAITKCYHYFVDGADGKVSGLPAYVAPSPIPVVIPDPGIYNRMIGIVNQIKNHTSYNSADGEDMGIEGAESMAKKADELQPLLTGKINGDHVEVYATKGQTQGFEVWVDRGTGTFAFLGFATSGTFVDAAALPDVSQLWRYQARYHQHNAVVGQWSDILSIKAVSSH